MTAGALLAVSPLIIVALAGTAVMLGGAFGARRETLHRLTVLSVGVALAALLAVRPLAPMEVTPLLRIDSYSILFLALLFSVTGVLAILSLPYLQARRCSGEAYYALLLFAGVGMGVLACSTHFASLFLGLETLTVSLYVLLGYLRTERTSLEAAAKYLILAAMASAFLLFGMALLYAATGTMRLSSVASAAAALWGGGRNTPEATWAAAGALMLVVGFGFKLALVPFHMWSPDVYQGAPAPITALIATGSKGAVIAALLRILGADGHGVAALSSILATLAVATMFAGNLLALLQTDLKRLLAYSSVAHVGYIFVALAVAGPRGGEAAVFYTVVYVATTLGAFGVVAALSSEASTEVDDLAGYRGLGKRRPVLAAVLGLMLLSLAGVPPTGGFLAKFAVLSAAVGAARSDLALIMVAASGIGIFYYLRVLVVMYMEAPGEAIAAARIPADASPAATAARLPASSLGVTVALAVLALFVLVVGVHPEPWLHAVGAAMASVSGG